jgi:hypothetical protein
VWTAVSCADQLVQQMTAHVANPSFCGILPPARRAEHDCHKARAGHRHSVMGCMQTGYMPSRGSTHLVGLPCGMPSMGSEAFCFQRLLGFKIAGVRLCWGMGQAPQQHCHGWAEMQLQVMCIR